MRRQRLTPPNSSVRMRFASVADEVEFGAQHGPPVPALDQEQLR